MFKPSVEPHRLDPANGPPPSPAAGVLVDCKRFPPGGGRVPRLQAIPKPKEPPLRSQPVSPPPRRTRTRRRRQVDKDWRTPAAMLGIGAAIVALLTLGGLYLGQAPAHADDAVRPTVTFVPRDSRLDDPPAASAGTVLPVAAQPVAQYVKPLQPNQAPAATIKPAPQPPSPATDAVATSLPAQPALGTSSTEPDGSAQAFAIAKAAEQIPAKPAADFCGTAVSFVATPLIAGQQAAKEHKLLFVLHVSGNFEDPGFT